jgi:hypothetical protein
MNLELPPSQTINALGSVPSRVLQPLQPGQLRCAQRDGFQQFPKSHLTSGSFGRIRRTKTTSRQIQFALKRLF